MLTLQQINNDPELIIKRLAVKQFDGREAITRVVELDKERRSLQKSRDDNAAVLNRIASNIEFDRSLGMNATRIHLSK